MQPMPKPRWGKKYRQMKGCQDEPQKLSVSWECWEARLWHYDCLCRRYASWTESYDVSLWRIPPPIRL